MKTKISFAQGAGAAAGAGFVVMFGLAVVGWFMNIIGLIQHLPALNLETLIRIIGIPLAPVGALLGYLL